MVTSHELLVFVASLNSDELVYGELIADCYRCKIFDDCENARAFSEEPALIMEFVDSYSQRSQTEPQ